jgi:hypothetical protein
VWLLDDAGKVLSAFDGGPAKQQVLAVSQGVLVTYFDEGALSSNVFSSEGLSLFSPDGSHLGGYGSRLGGSAVLIADCYCAGRDDVGRILFSPYTEFPLVRLNLETWDKRTWALPEELHSSQALTATSRSAFFWGSKWLNPSAIFSFDLDSGRVSDLGSVEADPRLSMVTLPDGRFVAPWQDRYFVIDLRG